MFVEHLVYSAVLAILVGMVFFKYSGRDPSWIVFAMVYFPDLTDVIPQIACFSVFGLGLVQVFHSMFVLVTASLLIAIVLSHFGIRFSDALVCSALGIFAHFFSDALVYTSLHPSQYRYFWPVNNQIATIGIMNGTRDLSGYANSTVLAVGIVLFIGALFLRTYVEGPGWWRVFLRGGREDKKPSP